MPIFINIVFTLITILAISLKRSYSHVPLKELKRRARKGDVLAQKLYQAASYGQSLQSLLTLLVIVSASVLFVSITLQYDAWLSALLVASLLWFGFLWLPRQEVDKLSLFIAKVLTPAIAWVLRYVHPVMHKISTLTARYRKISVHTGLWEKEDLIELLKAQSAQSDNRIERAELKVAENVLHFGDKKISDYITPRSVVKSVQLDEPIGPMLMTELHDSGFSRFPVYAESQDDLVGMLMLRDLVNAASGGTAKDYYQEEVSYIHEDQNLYDCLAAMLHTQQHLFVVVNSFEEYTGVISLEDVLEQLIGLQIVDEYDVHDNLRDVAMRMARVEHKKNTHPSEEEELLVLPSSDDNIDNAL